MTQEINEALKKTVVEAGRTMVHQGLTLGTWGNVSLRDPETGFIYITPSGIPYLEIRFEDIVVLDSAEEVVDGYRIPSVERGMHLAVYSARNDVNAVVHSHPLYSSVLGVNRMELPGMSEDFVQIVADKIICSEYALPGTPELARNVVAALGERNAVLLPNHGTLCVGEDMVRALLISHVVEKTAQIYIMAKSIGIPHMIAPEHIEAMQYYARHIYGQRPSASPA
jgi:L-fuculose-phosphate aldolase